MSSIRLEREDQSTSSKTFSSRSVKPKKHTHKNNAPPFCRSFFSSLRRPSVSLLFSVSDVLLFVPFPSPSSLALCSTFHENPFPCVPQEKREKERAPQHQQRKKEKKKKKKKTKRGQWKFYRPQARPRVHPQGAMGQRVRVRTYRLPRTLMISRGSAA